jgi:uncharacterized protein YegP (UPF0339 family)
MKFMIFRGGDRWYFHIVSRNGEMIARSKGYDSPQSATQAIMVIRNEAGPAEIEVAGS